MVTAIRNPQRTLKVSPFTILTGQCILTCTRNHLTGYVKLPMASFAWRLQAGAEENVSCLYPMIFHLFHAF